MAELRELADSLDVEELDASRRTAWSKYFEERRERLRAERQWGLWQQRSHDANAAADRMATTLEELTVWLLAVREYDTEAQAVYDMASRIMEAVKSDGT